MFPICIVSERRSRYLSAGIFLIVSLRFHYVEPCAFVFIDPAVIKTGARARSPARPQLARSLWKARTCIPSSALCHPSLHPTVKSRSCHPCRDSHSAEPPLVFPALISPPSASAPREPSDHHLFTHSHSHSC